MWYMLDFFFFIYLQQKTLKILKGTADHQAFIKGGHSLTLGLLKGSKGRLLWEQKIRYWKNDPVSHWIYDISKHFLIEFIISIAFFSWPHLESNNPEAGCSLRCGYLVNYKWLLIWECIRFSVIASLRLQTNWWNYGGYVYLLFKVCPTAKQRPGDNHTAPTATNSVIPLSDFS